MNDKIKVYLAFVILIGLILFLGISGSRMHESSPPIEHPAPTYGCGGK